MTGPDHYRKAESLIERALEASDGEVPTCWSFDEAIRTAQVHATLALAAATALNDAQDGTLISDWNAWREAASLFKPETEGTA